MNRADPSIGAIASQQDPVATDVIANSSEQCSEKMVASATDSTARMVGVAGERRLPSPVRLTLAAELGGEIDGAWWPRSRLISRELPGLVSVLEIRLGQVIDINVNWSALQNQQNLDWGLWRGIQPHVMTVVGRDGHAKLLIVPHRTGTALAVIILRMAAALPIQLAHRDSRAFQVAESVVRVARGEAMFGVRRPGVVRGTQIRNQL
jgi:Family of unknown function (DUF5994)